MEEKKRILIVEDDPVNRFLMQDILLSYETECVEDIPSMYNKIKSDFFPDLILLDVMLPDIDGFEAARHIKDEFAIQDVPIVFVTAKTEGESVRKGFQSGAYDYVKKPFDRVEFLTRVENVFTRSEKEKQLRFEASTDPLTGLYNRRYFNSFVRTKISYCLRKNINLVLAMLDIDYFKNINDNYSHLAGDEVLIQFGEFLQASLRDYDVVARYGGEEFIIAFLDCKIDVARIIFNRIKDNLKGAQISFSGKEIDFTFSAGLAELSEIDSENDMITPLTALADKRLYKAKESGRDQIVSS